LGSLVGSPNFKCRLKFNGLPLGGNSAKPCLILDKKFPSLVAWNPQRIRVKNNGNPE